MTVWQKYCNKRRYRQTSLINYVESEGTVLCANSRYQKFTDKEISSRAHCSFLCPTLFFRHHLFTHQKTHTQTNGPSPPSSPSLQAVAAKAAAWQWRQQRRRGNKGVTATLVTAQWRQRDSWAVAEGIAWRQRWRDIAAVAVTWLRHKGSGDGTAAALAQ